MQDTTCPIMQLSFIRSHLLPNRPLLSIIRPLYCVWEEHLQLKMYVSTPELRYEMPWSGWIRVRVRESRVWEVRESRTTEDIVRLFYIQHTGKNRKFPGSENNVKKLSNHSNLDITAEWATTFDKFSLPAYRPFYSCRDQISGSLGLF